MFRRNLRNLFWYLSIRYTWQAAIGPTVEAGKAASWNAEAAAGVGGKEHQTTREGARA